MHGYESYLEGRIPWKWPILSVGKMTGDQFGMNEIPGSSMHCDV